MKLFKTLGIVFLALIAIAFTSCTTNFCSEQDIENICNQLIYNYDNDDGSIVDIYHTTPTVEQIASSKVTSEEGATWADLATAASTDEDRAAAGKTLQYDYAYYIYKNNHSKACLVTSEHVDAQTGAVIESKTFGYAFKCGLLEILAYPVSWAFTTIGGWLGGTGYALMFAVLIVTFIIRALMLAATWRSTKQSQKLQMLQPQLNAINAKYANRNDEGAKAARAQETMALYKKNKVNPVSSLIAPFITLPIFIATYGAVRDTALIAEGYVFNVSLGQTLGSVIMGWNIFGFVVFVLMVASQFVSMKITQWLNKKNMKGRQAGQQGGLNQQNFMTYFFIIMIVIIGWMLPLAMSLYWIFSSWFSILQAVLMNYFTKRNNKLETAR